MFRTLRAAALAAACLSMPAAALAQSSQPAPDAPQSQGADNTMAATGAAVQAPRTDAEFVPLAVSSNLFEIETSRLALKASQSEDVRRFAQKMIDDHTKASTQMMAAVTKAGLTPPPMQMSERHAAMVATLQNASGQQFDQQYMQMQMSAHNEAVSLFSAYAKVGESGPIKDFAETTLPVLKQHHEMLGNRQPS